jgi:hypothetical protein
MAKLKARYRKPTADEQAVVRGMTVRLIYPGELPRFNEVLEREHYLKSAQLVGECLRYVAVWRKQWLAVAAWSAPALHLKARDQFIGWTEERAAGRGNSPVRKRWRQCLDVGAFRG